ncbi:MAG: DUF1830 domain-containing protein [Synechococcus sp.]|nr:DUF1830 domain-containing protein [Synechococcus sp.]
METCHYSSLCHYLNQSKRLIVARCIKADVLLKEKILFPFEEWYFDAPSDAHVEIWSNGSSGAEIVDRYDAASLALAV